MSLVTRTAAIGALVAMPLGLLAAPEARAAASAQPSACPAPVPVDEVTEGMTGSGLTVSKGTTPEPFDVTVQGVLDDGIAPGVDMIVVEADSPALDRAGGIWSGMSGSPVYTEDGRLMGAVAYGFTFGPSKVGGLTPAEDMYEVLEDPARVRTTADEGAAKDTAALPASLQRRLVASGAASERQASQGLARLPMPLGVSGVSEQRLQDVQEKLTQRGLNVRVYRASAAGAGQSAPPSAIVPGGNFAAALSYGFVSLAGVGTTTVVCDGTALAFGHPFTHLGPVAMSAHAADAVTVVNDPAGTPFKLANLGGVAGTLDQDRLTAIRAQLGDAPEATPVTSEVSGDRTRGGTTRVNMDEHVADETFFHLVTNLDLALDRLVVPGTAKLNWRVTGRTASGRQWTLNRTNRYASREDITFEAPGEIAAQLATITANRFGAVEITDVDVTASVDGTFQRYTVGAVRAKMGGKWVKVGPNRRIKARAGKVLRLRVTLTAYRAPSRTVTFRIKVPKNRKGSTGRLTVVGRDGSASGSARGDSVLDIVKKLQNQPRNNDLRVTLRLGRAPGGPNKPATIDRLKRQNQVVGGRQQIPVAVR